MAENADKTALPETGGEARLATAPIQDAPSKSEEESNVQQVQDEDEDDDRKAHLPIRCSLLPEFPFEIGETVWIVQPGYRAPRGEFRITKVHPDDLFELVDCATNVVHPDFVEGKYLRRDI
ncbi:serine threonine kinase [Fusarium pseudoanthophilum]|uniref:Serine threonine kinase n=1 Tax=Fusarium pseudoanthophilum TaxID=48495 RepID=A0A8H5L7C6_9HYPO|nr:serine threonine kinase [Fusarium pseudoanthophilum]